MRRVCFLTPEHLLESANQFTVDLQIANTFLQLTPQYPIKLPPKIWMPRQNGDETVGDFVDNPCFLWLTLAQF